MAVVQNNNQQNQDNQDQNGNSQGSSATSPSPGVGVSGSSGAYSQAQGGSSGSQGTQPAASQPQQPQSGNPKATSSGRFTNLNSYLNANKNFNQEGGGLAGQINQNFQNQQGQINQNLQNNQQQFQNQAQQARTPYTDYSSYATPTFQNSGNVSTDPGQGSSPSLILQPTLPNRSTNNAQPAGAPNASPNGYQNFLDSVTADPTAAVNNQDVYNQFVNARDANYSGPTFLTGQTDLQQQASNYQQQAQQAQNENGRFGLLKQMFYNPGYSSGQQSLDNLMLQANPDQIKQLQTAQTGANKLTGNINQAVNQAGADATNYQNEAQNISGQAKSAIGTQTQDPTSSAWSGTGALGNLISSVNNQIPVAQQQMADKYSQLQQDFSNNKLSPTEMARAGIDQSQTLTNLFNGMSGLNNNTGNKTAFNEVLQSLNGGSVDPNAVYNYGTSLGNYVGPNNFQYNANNVASADQASNYNALNKLAGGSAGQFITDPTQAGTAANYDVNSLINSQLGSDISSSTANKSSQVQQLLKNLTGEQSDYDRSHDSGDTFNIINDKNKLLALLGQKLQ